MAKQRLAKFTIPRQRGVTDRPRLFAALDALRGSPGLWIGGAPGAGKTTLAASYVQARQLACMWFRVDTADNDLAEMFGSLSLAVGDGALRGTRLPVFGPEHAANPLAFARRYFRALYERAAAYGCFVWDNIHELHNGTPMEVVRVAVEEAPPDIQCLLLSRTAPPGEFAALEAARKLERLPEQALAFTGEEMQELLPGYSASELNEIRQLTQGWSAGIVLAARRWSSRRSAGEEADGDARIESKEAIFGFFAHEVLRAMPVSEQRFLQLLSMLPETSVEHAQALTGLAESARILDSLYRRNLFTSYRRGDPSTYQFHALFREFLATQAKASIGADQLAVARRRAAQILLSSGNVSAALNLLIDAGEWQPAVLALVEFAPALLRQGRHATLRHWIEALPAELTINDAWLLYWMGQACAREDEMIACEWFDRAHERFAEARFEEDQRAFGRALCASAAIVAIQAAEATFSDLTKWSERLQQTLKSLPRPLALTDDLTVTAAIAVATVLGVPVLAKQSTLTTIERVLSLMEDQPFDLNLDLVTVGCSVLCYCQSQRNESMFARISRLVEPRLRTGRCSPLATSRWLIHVALCHFVFSLKPGATCRIELARAAFSEARAIAEREELATLRFELLMLESHFAIFEHDEKRHAELMILAGALVDFDRPFSLQEHAFALCGSHLRRGEIAQALDAAERGQKAARKAATPPLHRLGLCLAHGSALLAAGREDEAADLLQNLAGSLVDRQREVAEAFVRLAATWRERRTDAYLPLLREAFGVTARCGWTYFFLHIPEVAARLCADALANDIEPQFLLSCIEKRRLIPPADAGESWPWRVRIRMLGPFELQVGSAPAPFGPKTPRRQVELLQAIAISGAAGLDTGQALDWLWPDGDWAKTSLDVTLHRLRKLLGSGDVIAVRDGRLCFDPTLVWSDLAQFDAIGTRLLARDLGTQADADHLERLAHSLLALYRGPLLTEAVSRNPRSAWMLRAREKVRARFERLVHALGTQFEQRQCWRPALQLYTRALEHDDLAEEVYRGLIRCHLALAQPAEALRAFRRCRQSLSIVLGVPPAAQTLALVKNLREQGERA